MPRLLVAILIFVAASNFAHAHGDVAPQPVNTEALPDVGEEWVTENPYRNADKNVWTTAVEIGSSGYNQNCARCHGLGGVSGGIAPDLRFLEAEEDGDEWYAERFQTGYTQNGITKMPAFGELLGQKAAWAIRTYIEARPDDGALDEHEARLKEIRGLLLDWQGGDHLVLQAELARIAAKIKTGSGAPLADSAAMRAANLISGDTPDFAAASEALTIGLSAAK